MLTLRRRKQKNKNNTISFKFLLHVTFQERTNILPATHLPWESHRQAPLPHHTSPAAFQTEPAAALTLPADTAVGPTPHLALGNDTLLPRQTDRKTWYEPSDPHETLAIMFFGISEAPALVFFFCLCLCLALWGIVTAHSPAGASRGNCDDPYSHNWHPSLHF